MIALSPALSWILIGLVAGFAVTVYLLASGWLDRQERDKPQTFTEPADPQLRIFGGLYDAEARGDFASDEDRVQRQYDEAMERFYRDEWQGYP